MVGAAGCTIFGRLFRRATHGGAYWYVMLAGTNGYVCVVAAFILPFGLLRIADVLRNLVMVSRI